jgi:hypothetical protein
MPHRRPDAGPAARRRLDREERTLRAMVALYCRAHHGTAGVAPCGPCADLLAYARARLLACPLLPGKPACSDCRVHCYAPARREAVRATMRWAGPRMLLAHPALALAHLLARRRSRRAARASP